MRLDADTPSGLFKGVRGNKYIVSDDGEGSFAIVLQHDSLAPFSWLRLKDRVLDSGTWIGPYQLCIDKPGSPNDDDADADAQCLGSEDLPGWLGVGDRTAILNCRIGKDETIWMPLGYVRITDFADYCGWSLVAINGRTFFELDPSPNPNVRLLEVLDERPRLKKEID